MTPLRRTHPANLLTWLVEAWEDPESALSCYPATERAYSPHKRLVTALVHQRKGVLAGPMDLAVLLRAVLRAESGQLWAAGQNIVVPHWITRLLTEEHLGRASIVVRGEGNSGTTMAARPWLPSWLPTGASDQSPEDPLYFAGQRRSDVRAAGDPLLWRAQLDEYTSEAQREAVRTVLAAPPGSTVVVNLPTGSGKSLCATLPATLPLPDESGRLGVTPIIVPIVALGLDLELRTRQLVDHPTAYRPGTEAARDIALRCRAGIQGPVFLSPESLVGALAEPLREAARQALIRYFVVDEAHMVTAWGDDFRPAFQQVAGLRRELLNLCGDHPFVTVLMSATMTQYSMSSLYDLFGTPGPIHQVHAVRLRPEPSFWLCHAPSEALRQTWVRNALDHLPRPLILYTTRRLDAESWFGDLSRNGHKRIGLMHGGTAEDQRAALLEAWNQDRVDLVVATSAFGLGVDKPDIRAVIHGTCPEDIDRYYQDVGRSGRDGFASLSLMVRVNRDVSYARRLAIPKFIGIERGLERWRAMFQESEHLGDGHRYSVPLDVSPSHRPGDIDMSNEENERWSLRTLLLMRRAGLIEIEGSQSTRLDGVYIRTVQLVIREHEHLEPKLWETRVEPLREELLAQCKLNWALLEKALTGRICLAHAFEEAYTSPQHEVTVVRACGGCPACRDAGEPEQCGRLIPRHSPPTPWPTGLIGPALTKLFRDGKLVLLFYPSREPTDDGDGLTAFARWCCREGVRNLVLPKEWFARWRERLISLSTRPVFLFDEMPDGVVRVQPTAVLLFGTLDKLWADIWGTLSDTDMPLVLALPEDLRQPDRPDRLIRDILIRPPRLTLPQWEETYDE